jgi:hypothetical protein
MSISHSNESSSLFQTTGGTNPEMGFLQSFEGNDDPVEAYFECITQCSLDDGECVTVCTTILREQT